jgi:ribosome-binding protein aMBF1 (putative translation factor)
MAYNPNELPKAVRDGLFKHGILVRAAREAAKLSIQELAERSLISVKRIEAFEAGGAVPHDFEAENLAKATAVVADFFVEVLD